MKKRKTKSDKRYGGRAGLERRGKKNVKKRRMFFLHAVFLFKIHFNLRCEFPWAGDSFVYLYIRSYIHWRERERNRGERERMCGPRTNALKARTTRTTRIVFRLYAPRLWHDSSSCYEFTPTTINARLRIRRQGALTRASECICCCQAVGVAVAVVPAT